MEDCLMISKSPCFIESDRGRRPRSFPSQGQSLTARSACSKLSSAGCQEPADPGETSRISREQFSCIKEESSIASTKVPGGNNSITTASGLARAGSIFSMPGDGGDFMSHKDMTIPENNSLLVWAGTASHVSSSAPSLEDPGLSKVAEGLSTLTFSEEVIESVRLEMDKEEEQLDAANTSFTSDLSIEDLATVEDRGGYSDTCTETCASVASRDNAREEWEEIDTDDELQSALEMTVLNHHRLSLSSGLYALQSQQYNPTWDWLYSLNMAGELIENSNNNSSCRERQDLCDCPKEEEDAWPLSSRTEIHRNNILPPLGSTTARARAASVIMKTRMMQNKNMTIPATPAWSQDSLSLGDQDSMQVGLPTREGQRVVAQHTGVDLKDTVNLLSRYVLHQQPKDKDDASSTVYKDGPVQNAHRCSSLWSDFDSVSVSLATEDAEPSAPSTRHEESEDWDFDNATSLLQGGKTQAPEVRLQQSCSTPASRRYNSQKSRLYPHGSAELIQAMQQTQQLRDDMNQNIQSMDAPSSRTEPEAYPNDKNDVIAPNVPAADKDKGDDDDDDDDDVDNDDDSNDDEEDYRVVVPSDPDGYDKEEEKPSIDKFKFYPRAMWFANKMIPDFLKAEDHGNECEKFDDEGHQIGMPVASAGHTKLHSTSTQGKHGVFGSTRGSAPSQPNKKAVGAEGGGKDEETKVAGGGGGSSGGRKTGGSGGGDSKLKTSFQADGGGGGGGDDAGKEKSGGGGGGGGGGGAGGGGKKGGRPSKLPQCCLPNNMQPMFFIGGGSGTALVEGPLLALGWKRTVDRNDERYKLKWVENKSRINYVAFREGEQLVNHIPNCGLLTNKLGLLCSLQEYERVTLLTKGRLPRLKMADFVPETYKLDERADREKFLNEYQDGETWICKPTSMNQGKGIFLLRSREEINQLLQEREAKLQTKASSGVPMMRIVQRYLREPLLLEARKFDIRSYMFIASTVPFLVLYHKGYVRLSCQKYSQDDTNLTIHLTNQFVQKKDPAYKDVKEDTAWTMDKFNDYVNEHVAKERGLEHDWVYGTLTKQMQRITLHCFNSVKHKLQSKLGYFDLYGLDFMVDSDMKVWLIEINANPALHTNCSALKEAIPCVVEDALYLALECFEKSRKGQPLLPLNSLGGYSVLYCGSSPNCIAPRQIRSVSPFKDVIEWNRPSADGGCSQITITSCKIHSRPREHVF